MVQSHLPPFRNLGNFVHLTLPVSFGRDTKSRWSILSGVYSPVPCVISFTFFGDLQDYKFLERLGPTEREK